MYKPKVNTIPKLLLHFFMCTIFLNTSCSEESLSKVEDGDNFSSVEEDTVKIVLEKNEIENATLSEKLIYKDHHLTSLIEEVLKVNPNFENMDVFKKGGNDAPAVYIEDLLDIGSQKSENDLKLSETGKHSSILAFSNLEGETWYPVLKLLEKGNGGSKKAIFLSKSFDENSNKEFVKGYQLKQNGKLELVYEKFTKEMYQNVTKNSKAAPSIYLTSLHDCYATGDPIEKLPYKGGCGTSGSSGTSKTLNIEKIRISDKKESWIEKADIEFQGFKIKFNGEKYIRTFSISSRSSYINLTGAREGVTKISNNEIGRKETVNFKIGMETSSSFVFTLYEWDSWPAPKRYMDLSVLPASCECFNSNYDYFGFRSWQTPYFNRVFALNRYGINDVRPVFGKSFNSIEDNFSATIFFSD